MEVSVVMPQLGNEIEEAQIAKWMKAVGDRVEAGEVVLVIETPKVTLDIEAPASGILTKIFVEADDLASVGAELGMIEGDAA